MFFEPKQNIFDEYAEILIKTSTKYFSVETENFSRSVAKQQEIKNIEAKLHVIYFPIGMSHWCIVYCLGTARLGCGCMWETIESRKDKERPDRERVFYLVSTYSGITTQASGTAQTSAWIPSIKTRLHSHIVKQQSKHVNRECLSFKLFSVRIDALYRKHSDSIDCLTTFFVYR